MSIVEGPDKTGALVQRVKAILLKPNETWDVIDAEPATLKGLYTGYVAPLAAIGPVCTAVGQLAFGRHGGLNLVYRPPVIQTVAGAFVGWVLAMAGVYVFALIVEALATQFGGVKERMQAFKLAAYAGTASWVAGVFAIFPPVSALSILGLYSLYLLYLGLPKLMKVSGDKAMIYTICAIVAAMGVFFLISILAGVLLTPLFLVTSFAP